MPYQPVVNVAQVKLEGVVDRQMTINDLYFEISGGGINTTNLSTLAFAVATWWGNELVPNLSEDWSSVRAVAIDLTTATGPSVEMPLSVPGGVGVEAAPNNVAACVKFSTAQRGRFARGRNFVPGVPNSQVLLNTLQPAFINALTTAYSQLVGPGEFVAGWQWVVVSRYLNNVQRASGLAIPVTGASMVGNVVRSMRSREVGHGR